MEKGKRPTDDNTNLNVSVTAHEVLKKPKLVKKATPVDPVLAELKKQTALLTEIRDIQNSIWRERRPEQE